MKITIRLFASLASALVRRCWSKTSPTALGPMGAPRCGPSRLHFSLSMWPSPTYVAADVTSTMATKWRSPARQWRAERRRFWITEERLSLDAVAELVTAPEHGAIALFSGTVRGVTGELETDHLEYEAYAEMAEEVLAQIGGEVQEKWPQVLDVAIVHRIGRLEVGESSVMIAVAAAHRQGVFDACSYAIERLKQIAPIWKKEVGPDGSFWVERPGGQIGVVSRSVEMTVLASFRVFVQIFNYAVFVHTYGGMQGSITSLVNHS